MTTSPLKRLLTEETRQSLTASNASPESTPDDIAFRLRSIGSRVRKNVLEGYISSPSSFSKANSTGTIFRSARDTLNEVYRSPLQESASLVRSKKRPRSLEDQAYDSDGAVDEDNTTDKPSADRNSEEDAITVIMGPDAKGYVRPMKALRRTQRPMLATRSLPSGILFSAQNELSGDVTMKSTAEEDDWSTGNFLAQTIQPPQDDASSPDPMILA